eukprot:803501-Rhodomonas_salina.1
MYRRVGSGSSRPSKVARGREGEKERETRRAGAQAEVPGSISEFARREMKRMGYSDGQGLGKDAQGVRPPTHP